MILNFEDYRQKGLRFYKRVVRNLEGTDDLAYADRLVNCILHVLRDRFSFEESLNFISYLPMHVKGMYVHGWRLNDHPKRLSSVEEFLNAIRMKYPHTSGRQLGSDEELMNHIRGVFSVICSEGKGKGSQDVARVLPEAMRELCSQKTNIGEKDEQQVQDHFPEDRPIKNSL